MLFMADTNILLRFVSPSDPNHILVRDAIYSLLERGEEVCYSIYPFITQSRKNKNI